MSHHPAKFGDYRYCIEICHVTSHNHFCKRSSDFMVESPSLWVTTLLTLATSGTVVVEIKRF